MSTKRYVDSDDGAGYIARPVRAQRGRYDEGQPMELYADDRGTVERARTTDATWDAFLVHLATMSPLGVSRMPGMPSPKAFERKRVRDPGFGARARAIIESRQLRGSGFHRSTPEQWASFLDAVGYGGVGTVCRKPGMPSAKAVYKRQARDAAFAAALAARKAARPKVERVARVRSAVPRVKKAVVPGVSRAGASRARHGIESFRAHLYGNAIYCAAMAATHHLAPSARDDVMSDMVLAVLEGQVELGDLKNRAKEFSGRHWQMFGTFGAVSLDAPASTGSGITMGDCISADAGIWA